MLNLIYLLGREAGKERANNSNMEGSVERKYSLDCCGALYN